MSTLKIEHIANIANSGPDISIDTSGHLNIVNGSLQMGGTTMLDTSDTTLKNVSKIGIGTASPQQLLHVNGGAADTTIQITNSVSGSAATDGFSLTVENPSGDVNIRNREATNMRFYTGNVERMRIDSSGRFGIATGGAVETNAHANADDLVIGNTSNRTGMTIVSDPAQSGAIHFSDGTSTGNANIKGQLSYEHSDNSFRFYINSSTEVLRLGTSGGTVFNNGQDINQNFIVKASGNASALVIDGNGGNVGIGTASPLTTLMLESTGGNLTSGNAIKSSTMKGLTINAQEGAAHVNKTGVWIGSNGSHWSGMAGGRSNTSTWGTDLRFYTHEDNTADLTYSRERMIITSEGNVGIGTTVANSKLHVFNGEASITADADADDLIVENNGAAGITIGSSASSVGSIRFADSSQPRAGMLYYSHITNDMRIYTNQAQALSIIDDQLSIHYNGTAGGHNSKLLFKDKRGAANVGIYNNLQDDGVGSAAAHMEFHTSNGGTLAKAMDIDRYGKVEFSKMPNFATRPYYTNVELGAGAVVDMYNAHVNTGNHFNGTTNRFTAPYAGNYYFAFHSNIWNNAPSIMYFNWHKNGSDISGTYGGRIYGYYAGGWENMMGFVVLPLAANDYVDLRAGGGGPKVDGGSYGQFIGYALTTP